MRINANSFWRIHVDRLGNLCEIYNASLFKRFDWKSNLMKVTVRVVRYLISGIVQEWD